MSAHPANLGVEPEALGDLSPVEIAIQHSIAISAKRQADALERIADAFDQQAATGNVLHWLETIASALNAGLGR